MHWCGTEGSYNILVMELLGASLETLFKAQQKPFSLKCSILLAEQMISRIEYMHAKGFIHRDIKPDNFLMGLGEKSGVVYIIDYGLSMPYHDNKGNHIPYKSNKNLAGTARYASINNHRGVEQSRRDDLEGALYVLLYFLRGSLPWQGLPAQNRREKYKRILDVKTVTPPESLCKGFPGQLKSLLRYCRGLKFEESPNYKYIKSTLHEIAMENSFAFDNIFDWTAAKPTVHNPPVEEVKAAVIHEAKKENGERNALVRYNNSRAGAKNRGKDEGKKGTKKNGGCLVL